MLFSIKPHMMYFKESAAPLASRGSEFVGREREKKKDLKQSKTLIKSKIA